MIVIAQITLAITRLINSSLRQIQFEKIINIEEITMTHLNLGEVCINTRVARNRANNVRIIRREVT